jgi:hypothetical protein
MKTSLELQIISVSVLLVFTLFSNANLAFAKDHDDDDDDERGDDDDERGDDDFMEENSIQVCCGWGMELEDGILTYAIEDGDNKLKDSSKEALNSWNEAINEIEFMETNDDNADITISFRDDGKKIAGKTVNYFDYQGSIRKSLITISEESYDHEFSPAQIEQVTKHELGHTLGLGHANFNGNLMTERVDTGSGIISPCEIEAVKTANSWKLKEDGNSVHSPEEVSVQC